MRPRIEICAFEPFGGRRINRSLAAALAAARQAGRVVVLPCSFSRLPAALRKVLRRRPAAVLLCGEHGRATKLHVECVAFNQIDAPIRDNDGHQPRNRTVQAGGPRRRAATWPAMAVLRAIRRRGIPARLSNDAGRFACNASLYLALGLAQRMTPPPIVGFLHVPAHASAMELRTIARGVRAALGALRNAVDERRPKQK
jgi:pyrrolidone-carboxylate peptidase